MQKRGLFIFIFLFVVPIVYSESVGITSEPSEPTGDAGCGVGDGCNLKCLDGDLDCSCESQRGNLCSEEYVCREKLLKNWENSICCSVQCEKRVFIKSESISYLLEKDEPAEKEYNELKLFFAGLLVAILIYFVLDLWESRNSLAYFVEAETGNLDNKGKEILKRKGKKIKKERPKKIKTITPLLQNIMEDLSRDERDTILKLIGKEGIRKEELRIVLGFNKDKIDYSLIKLARREIIRLRGDEENPKIYFKDWVK